MTVRGQEYGPNAWRNLIPSNGLLAEFEKKKAGDPKDDPRYQDSFYQVGDLFNNGKDTLKDITGSRPQNQLEKIPENLQGGFGEHPVGYQFSGNPVC